MAPRAIRRLAGAILLAGLFLTAVPSSAEAPPDAPKPPRGALAPEEELKTFQLQAGYQIQLAAAEPQVVDPVAMAFDEHGKLYVAELRVYPNEGIARNPKPVSRIVCLEDKNGDGVYETSTVFAEGLRIPNSVMPYKGGLIVCDAPDILYLEDTRKTGKADKKTVLYTGFDLANIQMLPNGLQLGLDNWIHCMGGNGGNITCPAKKEFGPVNTRGRNFRFQLEVPGSLEMESGGGQFGLAPDDAGNWFTATNAQHLRQIVFPDRALARNPFLALPATTLDISDHGPACQVFRISPFEAWRVERTSRRKDDPVLSKRLPATELVPGGFATSACSPIVQGDRVYVCDPANNLIIGERLLANGVPFRAKRDDGAKADFLASTDNWFRPTCLVNGPIPGAIYVADFYREVIETPLSLPEDIKQKFNLQSRDRGRIWCITPKDPPAKAPSVLPAKMTSAELVAALASENRWLRMTAHRLLIERKPETALPELQKLAGNAAKPLGQLHALGVLEAYSALKDETLLAALKTATHEGTLLQALRLAEPRLAKSAELRTAVIALSESKSKALVFAAAIALGGTGNDAAATRALIQVYKLHAGDPWIAPAVLSSSKDRAIDMLSEQFAQMERFEPTAALGKLAGIAARANRKGYLQLVGQSMLQPGGVSAVSFLLGHLDGTSEVIIAELQVIAPKAVQHWTNELAQAAKNAANVRLEPEARVRAVQLLGFGSAATLLDSAQTLLQPNQPQAVQLAAVAALGRVTDAKAADLLLKHWAGFSPEVRKAALEVLAQRKEGVRKLLLAVQEQKVALAQIDATRTAQLKAYPDPAIRELAGKLFSGGANASRQKVIDDYKVALETKGDPAKGKAIFKKNCAACHKLENVGNDVGANLIAALGNKTPDALLIDILDPSREVDPRYLQYTLSTLDGRVLVGVVAGETASGVTLRIAEKGEVTILRSEIDKLTASGQSLMPAGLEQQVSKDDLAHLIAYLMTQREKK